MAKAVRLPLWDWTGHLSDGPVEGKPSHDVSCSEAKDEDVTIHDDATQPRCAGSVASSMSPLQPSASTIAHLRKKVTPTRCIAGKPTSCLMWYT